MSGSRFSSEFAMAFDQLAKYVDLIAAETAQLVRAIDRARLADQEDAGTDLFPV